MVSTLPPSPIREAAYHEAVQAARDRQRAAMARARRRYAADMLAAKRLYLAISNHAPAGGNPPPPISCPPAGALPSSEEARP
jgi:hypothetical protein